MDKRQLIDEQTIFAEPLLSKISDTVDTGIMI